VERALSIALAVVIIAVPVGLWIWSLRRHAHQGGMFDWAKARVARLEVPASTQETRELIYRGLYEALGTRTPPRKKHREDFKIISHLDGDSGPPHPDEAPARVEQVDRLAHWFVDSGGCRLLETRWGRP
jgi:hypothetical protein